MIKKKTLRLFFRRFLLVFGISLIGVFVLSEIAYAILQEGEDKLPMEVVLVIPDGTAEKVAAGEEEPNIPDEIIFIQGDTLRVDNEDQVPHQLGPVFIPAGSSASLKMDEAENFEYSCSFRPTQYLGLNVREATTLNIRLIALGYVTPATAIFIFLYSLVIYPLEPSPQEIPA